MRRSPRSTDRRPRLEDLESRLLLSTIDEFPLPTLPVSIQPGSITRALDGNLWFTETSSAGSGIGRITPSGTVTNFALPSDLFPRNITGGPDGNLWFTATTATGPGIGRITPSGQVSEFPLAAGLTFDLSAPRGITAGPDGNVWFVTTIPYNFPDPAQYQIGQITPGGQISEFAVPDSLRITDIATGPDGNLWFTRDAGPGPNDFGEVDRIRPDGVINGRFPVPVNDADPLHIPAFLTDGPDGALWFTELNSRTIGRITTDGNVSQFPLPESFGQIGPIVEGPDGALEFLANVNSFSPTGPTLGRITTSGVATDSPLFSSGTVAHGIVTGPDGALWITDSMGRVDRSTPQGVITEFPVPGFPRTILPNQVTAGPDGNVWFTASKPAFTGSVIGHLNPTGGATLLTTPAGTDNLGAITTGPDGNLWVGSDFGIDRVTPGGTFTSFKFSDVGQTIRQITTGPDGALWFTDLVNEGVDGPPILIPRIGRITTIGVVTLFEIPDPDHLGINPDGIVTGSDGALWFHAGSMIGRITTSGAITEFTAGSGDTSNDITAGPDGALWFPSGHAIGRITTSGVVTDFPVDGSPNGITTGRDGGLWFTLNSPSGLVGRIGTEGTVRTFAIPTPGTIGGSITSGPDGNIDFAEPTYGAIGRVNLDQLPPPIIPTPPPPPPPLPVPPGPIPTPPDLVVSGLVEAGVARVGEGVAFGFVVTNRGVTPATDVVLALVNPPGVSFVEYVPSRGRSEPAGTSPGLTLIDFGPVAGGASVSVALDALPIKAGLLVFTAAASSVGQADASLADNLAFAATVVIPQPPIAAVDILATKGQVSAIQVDFRVPLVRSQAQNPRNYHLSTIRIQGTRVVHASIPVRSARYDEATGRVTLRLAGRAVALGVPITLIVDGLGLGGPITQTTDFFPGDRLD